MSYGIQLPVQALLNKAFRCVLQNRLDASNFFNHYLTMVTGQLSGPLEDPSQASVTEGCFKYLSRHNIYLRFLFLSLFTYF